MSDKKPFTQEQLENWREYERVRESGKFNMFHPYARMATGLDKKEYYFCLENYDALRDAILKPMRKA